MDVKKRDRDDKTGKKYGRLTVIKKDEKRINGHIAYLCKCECGNEKIIKSSSLTTGKTISCGCYRWDVVSLEYGQASFNRAYKKYIRNANMRGYEWSINPEEFRKITQQECFYCGRKPSNICKDGRVNGAYVYNGIDRKDNIRGYVIDNIVPCCFICNRMKADTQFGEFLNLIKNIYTHIFVKEEK